MPYEIIQPPFTLKFSEMAKKELEAYGEWFHAITPERIAELTGAVKATAGFGDWRGDRDPESLVSLGEWFRKEVEIRRRTEAEMGEIRARLAFPIDVPDEELTNRAFSLAI